MTDMKITRTDKLIAGHKKLVKINDSDSDEIINFKKEFLYDHFVVALTTSQFYKTENIEKTLDEKMLNLESLIFESKCDTSNTSDKLPEHIQCEAKKILALEHLVVLKILFANNMMIDFI